MNIRDPEANCRRPHEAGYTRRTNLGLALIQRESLSKVHPANLRVIPQLMRGSGAKDFSFGDDVSAVGNRERFTHVMVGYENADSARFQIEDDLLQVEHSDGVDAAEGLIEQQEARLDAEAAGNLDAAALTAGERIALGRADVAQVQLLNETLGANVAFGVGNRLRFEDAHDVVFNGELAEDGWLLGQVADAVIAGPQVHGNAGDLSIVDHDATRFGNHQAHNHVKTGSFACAVGAKQPDNFSSGDGEVDLANYLPAAVGFADSLGAECLHSHPMFCCAVVATSLQLLFGPRFGFCLATVALDGDALIAAMVNQRTAGDRSARLVDDARRYATGARESE